MTPEVLVISLARIAGSLPVLRLPSALHVGRVFDRFSSLDALDGIWTWLTGS